MAPDISGEILGLERRWLDRWIRGDTAGYLELCADDVRYFDSFLGYWIDGITPLSEHLGRLRGKTVVDGYDIEQERVLLGVEVALLTYVWQWRSGALTGSWCVSDSYRLQAGHWRIFQGIWSSLGSSATRSDG